jgi:uncharacterized membrane protein (UPF0136 family)
MADPNSPRAGGFLIAVLTMAGVLIGGFANQPTIGLLAGLAAGVAVAVTIWLVDRAKRGG